MVVAVDDPDTRTTAAEVAPAPVPVANDPAASRPRLSRTVTLGQGANDLVVDGAPPTQQGEGAPQGGSTVVNNVTNVYGGYGYGGYVYGGRGVQRGRGVERGTGQSHTGQPSVPTGSDGGARTAAPGQTPHVGGNWPSAPSYGPSTGSHQPR